MIAQTRSEETKNLLSLNAYDMALQDAFVEQSNALDC